jgi:pimeloyl-ACP methyl ester carboxylesterase
MQPRVILLTGMTPDARLFDRLLPLVPQATVLPWIVPRSRESLAVYAARLADAVDEPDDVIICGASFGGMVARELAWRLGAKVCVLVSTVRSHRELPRWMRLVRPVTSLAVLQTVGAVATAWRGGCGASRRLVWPSSPVATDRGTAGPPAP